MKTALYSRIFCASAQAGLFPGAFEVQARLGGVARKFQSALHRFDQEGMGNDVLVELAKGD